MEKELDIAGSRQRLAGDEAGGHDMFDGFSFPGLVKTAHAEMTHR